jgi:hypothetical protein
LVSAQAGFLDKLAYAIELIGGELPQCCATHLHGLGGDGSGAPAKS